MTAMTDDPSPTRRDFLQVCTVTFGAVGGALAVWPLIDQMNPNPGTPSGSIFVELAPIRAGQAVTVAWRAQPVLIRHRTPDEIARARDVPTADLPDPYARNAALPDRAPAVDANRAQRPEWLVVVGLCTHLGCKLMPGDGEGWFCPCHAARFDLSGRVRSGPAYTNLAVPPYRFVTPGRIEIGRP